MTDTAYRKFCEVRKGSPLSEGEFGAIYSRVEAAWIEQVETAIRKQIAQELHDWAALHAGPDGAFFADLWERRIARGES